MIPDLPIRAVLPELLAALATGPNAVLVAPPGAGKTTAVPLALLEAEWLTGQKLILLSPRRLAARAVAHRMADLLGERVGDTVGYRVRFETRVSARTRIEVVTEGVFTRLLLDQPELPGIGAVLFDEYHERSLDADLGLALALDVQAALRPDLRLLPMSATLDGAAVARLLGAAPVIESAGRMYPVETVHAGRRPDEPVEPQVARLVKRALAEQPGSALVFLPGQAEIARVAAMLADCGAQVHPLHGGLELKDQQAAIAPAPAGGRKVVLATSIAETSLTIEGVRIVVDSGLARRPRFEPGLGLSRLVTERVSQAAAEQRRGRAGRLEPGACYRLWDAAETRGLPAFDPPEILNADLAPLVLDLAEWGVADPASLRWLDPPPPGAWGAAQALLTDLDALDADGRITPEGRALARLPLHPRLAHMVHAAAADLTGLAAEVAALVSERGLGGPSQDLSVRVEALRRDRSPRAQAARQLVQRWARLAGADREATGPVDPFAVGRVVALGFPDRIANARPGQRGAYQMASGRAAQLDSGVALAGQPFLAVAEVTGSAERARIVAAAPLDEADLLADHARRIRAVAQVRVEGRSGAVVATTEQRLGALVLASRPLAKPAPEVVTAALIEHIRRHGLDVLPWTDGLQHWRARVSYLHSRAPADWPDVSDDALLASLETWLAPYLAPLTRLADLDADTLGHALAALLPAGGARKLEAEAPARLATPAGPTHAID
jgi:ATP-dependent helicase HrpB